MLRSLPQGKIQSDDVLGRGIGKSFIFSSQGTINSGRFAFSFSLSLIFGTTVRATKSALQALKAFPSTLFIHSHITRSYGFNFLSIPLTPNPFLSFGGRWRLDLACTVPCIPNKPLFHALSRLGNEDKACVPRSKLPKWTLSSLMPPP